MAPQLENAEKSTGGYLWVPSMPFRLAFASASTPVVSDSQIRNRCGDDIMLGQQNVQFALELDLVSSHAHVAERPYTNGPSVVAADRALHFRKIHVEDIN